MQSGREKKGSSFAFIYRIIIAIFIGSILGHILIYNDVTIIFLRFLITIGDVFSQFLGFFVPIVVLALTMPAIIDLGNKASKMLLASVAIVYTILIVVGMSCVALGYSFVDVVLGSVELGERHNTESYSGFFPELLVPFMDVVTALVLAIAFGMSAATLKVKSLYGVIKDVENIVYYILNSFVIPMIPIYIVCIFAKLSASGELAANVANFSMVILSIFVVMNVYTLLTNIIAAVLTGRSIIDVLKFYILPIYMVGFGTQSSKATIPVHLDAAEKINITAEVREFSIPLLATIHLIGSMITQVLGSIAVFYIFMGTMIDLSLMLAYIFILATILLAAPGIPGGEPVATKPILISYLGFPPLVAETMFTLGLANDSFATAVNVSADGPIVMLLEYIYKRWT